MEEALVPAVLDQRAEFQVMRKGLSGTGREGPAATCCDTACPILVFGPIPPLLRSTSPTCAVGKGAAAEQSVSPDPPSQGPGHRDRGPSFPVPAREVPLCRSRTSDKQLARNVKLAPQVRGRPGEQPASSGLRTSSFSMALQATARPRWPDGIQALPRPSAHGHSEAHV